MKPIDLRKKTEEVRWEVWEEVRRGVAIEVWWKVVEEVWEGVAVEVADEVGWEVENKL